MEEIYGYDYSISPENLQMIPAEYHRLFPSSTFSGDHHRRLQYHPYGSEAAITTTATSEERALITQIRRNGCDQRVDYEVVDEENAYSVIKAKIVSHPSYPKLLDAYINCQKVGAPPDIACLLDERGNNVCKTVSSCFGADPDLDEFMETYCDVLVKYKSDLARPFDEASMFLNKIETQLSNLCKDHEGGVSSEEECSGEEAQMTREERELKDTLLRKFGGRISLLKHEFSKKKKKGKLPKEAREALLEWWNLHHKWPYPTEADKISLAETTGLDQKQINNWFINQRKRHWKPSENMQIALMGTLSGQFYSVDD